jgi:hypothetical protein
MPPSVMVLGPSLDKVIEPLPDVSPSVAAAPGRRQIAFNDPPTDPGGVVRLKIMPPLHPEDVLPINVYAFFVQPVASVPPQEQRTPDWFFKSGSPSGSIHVTAADENGEFEVVAAGVKPSLDPYFVQTVLEFPAS